MQNGDNADQLARDQAALAEQARAQQVANSIDTAQAAVNGVPARRRRWDVQPAPPGVYVPPPPGHVLPPLQPGQAIPGVPVPPPPEFAVGALNALADVSTAMTAIVESLTRRPGNNSRARDGDVVINKDISGVFDEVPENILERVKYVKVVENRLITNMSGVRYKSDHDIISSVLVSADASVATNFRMYEFKNVDVIVPFAVVFSHKGRQSTVMLTNSAGDRR